MIIDHDFHLHTYLSVCGEDDATIANYVKTARELGIRKIGISDHMWDAKIPFVDSMRHSQAAGPDGEVVLNWYRKQNIEYCRQILRDLEQTDTQGIQFLFGGEVDYCPGLGAAITVEEAEKLDFMTVPNSHTHHLMYVQDYEPKQRHADFMLRAAMEICTAPTARFVTALAHPFDSVCAPYPREAVVDVITDSQLEEVFSAAREHHIAVEINVSSYGDCPPDQLQNHFMTRVLLAARKCGCMFTFGSDAHTPSAQYALTRGPIIADILGITEADLHPIVR